MRRTASYVPCAPAIHTCDCCRCRRFKELVEANYFSECRLYRVVPGFIIQWGIPADPAAYQKWGDNKIRDDQVKVSDKPRTLSFATSGPDARGSQVFVNLEDNDNLDGQGFSPFAEVTKGYELFAGCQQPAGKIDQNQGKQSGNAYFTKACPEASYWAKAVIKG